MLKVGLTGGIGVGKTTVSDCFERLAVPVVDTDVIARDLVGPGSAALKDVVSAFGPEVLTDSGELDRKLLGRIVFSDAKKKSRLESILHPRIKQIALEQMGYLDTAYCVVVVPLLIETDFVDMVDKVLVVDAPDEQRMQWVRQRNGLSQSEIMRIIEAQTSRERRMAMADYVIVNDGSIAELEHKVSKVHAQILSECGNSV